MSEQVFEMSVTTGFCCEGGLEMLRSGSLVHGLNGTVDHTHSEMAVTFVSSHTVRSAHPRMPFME